VQARTWKGMLFAIALDKGIFWKRQNYASVISPAEDFSLYLI
jgi:hypothetical protein